MYLFKKTNIYIILLRMMFKIYDGIKYNKIKIFENCYQFYYISCFKNLNFEFNNIVRNYFELIYYEVNNNFGIN